MASWRSGASSLLLLVLFAGSSLAQGLPPNLISLIPQPDVPVAPETTILARTQAQVQQGGPFSVSTGQLVVVDAEKSPSDWLIDVEGLQKQDHQLQRDYLVGLDVNRPNPPWINPMKGQFTWTGKLEVPAKAPFGVVGVPPDILKQEQIPNPAVVQPLPKPIISSASDRYSHTTNASDHTTVRLLILTKCMQKSPDAANGGKLTWWVFIWNTTDQKWNGTPSGGTAAYQVTIMDLHSILLNYHSSKVYLTTKDNGDVVVKWRVELRNGNGQHLYDFKEGELVVWSNRTTSP